MGCGASSTRLSGVSKPESTAMKAAAITSQRDKSTAKGEEQSPEQPQAEDLSPQKPQEDDPRPQKPLAEEQSPQKHQEEDQPAARKRQKEARSSRKRRKGSKSRWKRRKSRQRKKDRTATTPSSGLQTNKSDSTSAGQSEEDRRLPADLRRRKLLEAIERTRQELDALTRLIKLEERPDVKQKLRKEKRTLSRRLRTDCRRQQELEEEIAKEQQQGEYEQQLSKQRQEPPPCAEVPGAAAASGGFRSRLLQLPVAPQRYANSQDDVSVQSSLSNLARARSSECQVDEFPGVRNSQRVAASPSSAAQEGHCAGGGCKREKVARSSSPANIKQCRAAAISGGHDSKEPPRSPTVASREASEGDDGGAADKSAKTKTDSGDDGLSSTSASSMGSQLTLSSDDINSVVLAVFSMTSITTPPKADVPQCKAERTAQPTIGNKTAPATVQPVAKK